jgi:hypothetical protein
LLGDRAFKTCNQLGVPPPPQRGQPRGPYRRSRSYGAIWPENLALPLSLMASAVLPSVGATVAPRLLDWNVLTVDVGPVTGQSEMSLAGQPFNKCLIYWLFQSNEIRTFGASDLAAVFCAIHKSARNASRVFLEAE